jgi:RNA polymerase sigma-70 factor (ECF subfamily)
MPLDGGRPHVSDAARMTTNPAPRTRAAAPAAPLNRVHLRRPASDAALAARAATGERRALEEMFRDHDPRVRRVCRGVLRDPHDAEDAAQEAWSRALRALPRFDGDDLGAWLATIARNESYRLAVRRRRSATPVDELPAVADPDADPYARARSAELGGALCAAIRTLPATYREVALRDLAGQGPTEIAAAMALSPGATRVRTHRARRAVQARLAGTALAGGDTAAA